MKGPDRELPHFLARLWVRPTADGGRTHSVFPGYRASWRVPQPDGSRAYADGAVYPVGDEELAPGTTGIIRLFPVRRESWRTVEPGADIEMCEGARVVGIASIERALAAGTADEPRRTVTTSIDG